MQFSSRRSAATVTPSLERILHVDLQFTQTGRYLIAAGSDRQPGHDAYSPVLYISLVGDKGWATPYPLEGRFAKSEDAAAAALHYGIQLITRKVRNVPLPGDPVPVASA
ncbi:MAG TPA: hypothetical protein VHP13_05190 [Gammaproteobacteria bacterium]|jgi:hypothetical protein|nr:hypothetical protein [Gammaproteobacteria bacterium]